MFETTRGEVESHERQLQDDLAAAEKACSVVGSEAECERALDGVIATGKNVLRSLRRRRSSVRSHVRRRQGRAPASKPS